MSINARKSAAFGPLRSPIRALSLHYGPKERSIWSRMVNLALKNGQFGPKNHDCPDRWSGFFGP